MNGSLGRCLRWVGIGPGPLRRRTDRVEAWLVVALTALVVACGPILVWRASASAYERAAAAADWQRNRYFPVHAVLLEDTGTFAPGYGENRHPRGPVRAEWTAPDGTRHVGPVVPPAEGTAGTTVLIWTDRAGTPGQRPDSDPTGTATGVGLVVALLVVAAYAGVVLGVRGWLNRVRMAAWQREWIDVEPRWSGRR